MNINKKHIQNIKTLIDSNKINRALREIQWLVLKIISDNRYTAVIYDSPELDQLCEEIGIRIADEILNKTELATHNISKHSIVIVCSRLQASGGHTRVIEDFIRYTPKNDVLVLVTEVPAISDRIYAEKSLTELGATVEWCGSGNLKKRLYWLDKRLLSAEADQIFLFNHHEDSVAVAAMQIAKEANIYFYHHGDHHLCLGVHLSGAEHIDIHAFGYENCRNKLGVANNTYYPLVTKDMGAREDTIGFMNSGQLVTCTAAGKNKVEIKHEGSSYIDLIPKLLSFTKGRHIHIGKLSRFARYRIRRALRQAGVERSAFIYIPWVKSVWIALHENKIDIYISSFPITGGKTLIEAMGSGTPVILYNNPKSRVLSGIDLVYPSAFIWSEEDDLFDYLQYLTPEKLLSESKIARSYFLKYYRDELLGKSLAEQVHHAPPPLNPFNTSKANLLVESRFSIKNMDIIMIIKNALYFRLKYFRSLIMNRISG